MLGLVEASAVRWEPSDALLEQAICVAIECAKRDSLLPEGTRVAIRELLRWGGFKPTGRSKPASEYLANAAKAADDSFPHISNLVDINNLVSLQTGWPCSIVDLELARAKAIEVRLGRKGETYVFNSAGQFIDLAGLICLANVHGDPIANPVKDSMKTKVRESTSRVLFVTYASKRIASKSDVMQVLEHVGQLLRQHAGAGAVESQCLATAISERR